MSTYHKWKDGVCVHCEVVATTWTKTGRPISPGPCGGKRTRARRHKWEGRESSSEDRLRWECVYCEAEAETGLGAGPGALAATGEVFYREKGGIWAQIKTVPRCRADLRMPITARRVIERNWAMRTDELALLLEVSKSCAADWIQQIKKHRKGQ